MTPVEEPVGGAVGGPLGGPAVLVMAKAPVPGQAKTRLGAVVGHEAAARLAGAAILDTLTVCEQVFTSRESRHVALAGDLTEATSGEELADRLSAWTVHPQVGAGFADRLARAHADVAARTGGPVVQIGMDTPHQSVADLSDVAARIGDGNDAVLGPAEDGGWWVLAVTDARFAQPLAGVEMSTDHTGADTLAALRAAGARVATAATLRDVDTPEDAELAAALAPETTFAQLWTGLRR